MVTNYESIEDDGACSVRGLRDGEICWEPLDPLLPVDKPDYFELPLNESWSPLRAASLRFARVRKLVYQALGSPLLLLPAACFSWWLLPVLSNLDFFQRMQVIATQAERDSLGSVEDVAISALSIVLGILLGTVVSVLRDRQQSLRQELFSEMAVVQACAQQHVKLFRRDKPRLRRSMQLLSAYVDEKRDLLQVLKDYDLRFASYEERPWNRYWDRQQRRSLAMLDVLAEMGDGILAGPRYGFALFNSLAALDKCEAALIELNERRATWRASLETLFPPSLFLTVMFLMLALIYCFVLRSAAVASGTLVSDAPLRLLFSLMCVSFTALLQIMLDLSDPFSGTYSIDISPEAVDVAAMRVRGALELADTPEPFDEAVDRASIRPSIEW